MTRHGGECWREERVGRLVLLWVVKKVEVVEVVLEELGFECL